MEKRVRRSKKDCKLYGVCGGIAEYFQIDPLFVRLGFIAAVPFYGCGVFLYVLCILLIPEADGEQEKAGTDREQEKTEADSKQEKKEAEGSGKQDGAGE